MKSLPLRNHSRAQAGFTIVELMIATAAFALVLLIILYGVLSFTHGYYSGLTSSTTQDTARNVVSTVSQAIEFSGTPITVTQDVSGLGLEFFCTGRNLFIYKPGTQYKGTTSLTTPGLYELSWTTGCPDPALPASLPTIPASGGEQLLGKGMRVAWLKVLPETSLTYSIDLRLALGDNDLLCAPSVPGGSCTASGSLPDNKLTTNDVACKFKTGYQFCAVASLHTIVGLRVEGAE